MKKEKIISLLVLLAMILNIVFASQVQASEVLHEVFPQGENTQMKIIANNSDEPSVNTTQSPQKALSDIIEYDVQHVASLRARAIAFGLIDPNEKAENWVVEKGGKTYLNARGQEVADKVATYLAGAEVNWVDGKTVGPVRVDGISQGEVVVNNTTKTYDGWKFLKVKTTDGRTHYVSAWCGNNAYPGETPPGIPEHPLPDPPPVPDAKGKDPEKDPAVQGNAPGEVAGRNAIPWVGKPKEAPTPPKTRENPAPPSGEDSQKEDSTPSNWTGAGEFGEQGEKTSVGEAGEVTTPEGEEWDPLKDSIPDLKIPGGSSNLDLPEEPESDW